MYADQPQLLHVSLVVRTIQEVGGDLISLGQRGLEIPPSQIQVESATVMALKLLDLLIKGF